MLNSKPSLEKLTHNGVSVNFSLAKLQFHIYQCSKDLQDQLAQWQYIDFDETCV